MVLPFAAHLIRRSSEGYRHQPTGGSTVCSADVFSALTLVGTRPVGQGTADEDVPDHGPAVMVALFSRPLPDWTDRDAVAAFAAEGVGRDSAERLDEAPSTWCGEPTD